MRFTIVTLFPELVRPMFEVGVVGRAVATGLLVVDYVNPRDFTSDRHRTVDDSPYGGGPGMVMKVEPLVAAVESITGQVAAPSAAQDASVHGEGGEGAAPADAADTPHRILMGPAGNRLDQAKVRQLAAMPHLLFICGRYEGIDDRVNQLVVDEEISLGDFVLSGGELGAMAVMDAVARYVPGVLGEQTSTDEESFSDGLLEYPQYTRPTEFRGLAVPEILSSGHHENIRAWRRKQSVARTLARRPDLLSEQRLSAADQKLVAENYGDAAPTARLFVALVHHPILDKGGRVVSTAVTNLDLHDIARSAATYGLGGYFVVTPVTQQREKVERILETWRDEPGREHRVGALALARAVNSLEDAIAAVEAQTGRAPQVIATSASPRRFPDRPRVGFADLRSELLAPGAGPRLLVLGTGWGLAPSLEPLVNQVLTPVCGQPEFNHLSVRSAAAVLFDRLFGIRSR